MVDSFFCHHMNMLFREDSAEASAARRRKAEREQKRKAKELRHLQSLLDDLAKDVSDWQEMDQYETFLEGLASAYDIENPEAIYEKWVAMPNRTTKQFHRMLSDAERNERREK